MLTACKTRRSSRTGRYGSTRLQRRRSLLSRQQRTGEYRQRRILLRGPCIEEEAGEMHQARLTATRGRCRELRPALDHRFVRVGLGSRASLLHCCVKPLPGGWELRLARHRSPVNGPCCCPVRPAGSASIQGSEGRHRLAALGVLPVAQRLAWAAVLRRETERCDAVTGIPDGFRIAHARAALPCGPGTTDSRN